MKKILKTHFLLLFSLLLMVSVLTSCGNKKSTSSTDDLKKKELELKEKELNLKEEELKRKEQSGSGSGYEQSASRLYPEASERTLNSRDVENLSLWDLKIMRNEIFADYGYRFKTEEMREYFSRLRWYSPRYDDVNNMLTKTEKDNIELIKRYEERQGNNDFAR